MKVSKINITLLKKEKFFGAEMLLKRQNLILSKFFYFIMYTIMRGQGEVKAMKLWDGQEKIWEIKLKMTEVNLEFDRGLCSWF